MINFFKIMMYFLNFYVEDTTKIKCLQYGFCVCKLVNKKCVTYFYEFQDVDYKN